MTGVIPRLRPGPGPPRPSDWPDSSSKTIQPPRAAAVLLPGARSPSSTPSMAPSSRSMARRAPISARPAAAAQQVPDPGDGVPHPEPPGHQVTDPGQRPPLVIESGGQRPGLQHRLQPASCCSSSRAPRRRNALRCQPGQAAGQPRPPPAPHRPLGHLQLSSNLRSGHPLLEPLHGRQLDPCSRRLRPSAVKPPPCGGPHTSCIPPETHPSAPRTSRIKELQPTRPRRA